MNMNDIKLPVEALYLIERFNKGNISLSRLRHMRTECMQRKDLEKYINVGLALTMITSLSKYNEKTGNS
ncbi:hypothetical protein B5G52_04180 [Pseudoalteromonas sp. A601]|uniref:hypothetical protein n=1 Tax=Pseudoalteromonas sp. A601 TaxID=1967839 RepID=UPI000B3BF331|nr:hypothetical protein [Pseudoalteromonas sp. A601]OUS73451.1 hypothetical protein B5G52_04180 [Pseudoalteromonas sp. A601]